MCECVFELFERDVVHHTEHAHSHIKVFLSLMQMYFSYVLYVLTILLRVISRMLFIAFFAFTLSPSLTILARRRRLLLFLMVHSHLVALNVRAVYFCWSLIRSLVHLVPYSLALLTWCFTCDHFLPKSLTFMTHTHIHLYVSE